MPTLLKNAPETPPPPVPPRKRWTRQECAALDVSGVFAKEHLELIDGELIGKMGKNRPHVNALMLMLGWLQEVFGPRFVNTKAPIDVGSADNPTNEPEPDLIVLNRDSTTITTANPQPSDLRLVVEIAHSTLTFDLTTKATLYARAGILEYWVLDVAGHRLIGHREPVAGKYASVMVYSENESIAPLTAPNAEFHPARVMPPPPTLLR